MATALELAYERSELRGGEAELPARRIPGIPDADPLSEPSHLNADIIASGAAVRALAPLNGHADHTPSGPAISTQSFYPTGPGVERTRAEVRRWTNPA